MSLRWNCIGLRFPSAECGRTGGTSHLSCAIQRSERAARTAAGTGEPTSLLLLCRLTHIVIDSLSRNFFREISVWPLHDSPMDIGDRCHLAVGTSLQPKHHAGIPFDGMQKAALVGQAQG